MMANYEIGEIIAMLLMQHLIDYRLKLSSKSVCTDAYSKHKNKNTIWVKFLFLIFKLKGFEF